MKVVAIIPARMASTRFPGKALVDVAGEPLVVHVLNRTRAAKTVDKVLVATDSDEIASVVRAHGGEAIVTVGSAQTGSDRVAMVVESLDADIVVNVQGDNAFLDSDTIDRIVQAFDNPAIQVVTGVVPFPSDRDPSDPSLVKALCSKDGRAVYFSRAPIPHGGPWWLHIGVYGFRRHVLQQFAAWPRTPLEKAEDLEQLRFIEHNVPIHVVPVPEGTVAVDTPLDLAYGQRQPSAPTGSTPSTPRH